MLLTKYPQFVLNEQSSEIVLGLTNWLYKLAPYRCHNRELFRLLLRQPSLWILLILWLLHL